MKIIKFNDLPELFQVSELRKKADEFINLMPDGKYTDEEAINICLPGMNEELYIKSYGIYYRAELKEINSL